jgi:hypothetical protein
MHVRNTARVTRDLISHRSARKRAEKWKSGVEECMRGSRAAVGCHTAYFRMYRRLWRIIGRPFLLIQLSTYNQRHTIIVQRDRPGFSSSTTDIVAPCSLPLVPPSGCLLPFCRRRPSSSLWPSRSLGSYSSATAVRGLHLRVPTPSPETDATPLYPLPEVEGV